MIDILINFLKKHLLKLLFFLVLLGAKCPCCGGSMFTCVSSFSLISLIGVMVVATKDLVWKLLRK